MPSFRFTFISYSLLQIYRHLIGHIIQKLLSKSLVGVSEVARLFRQLTPKEKIESIVQFLKNGSALDMSVFNSLLVRAIELLSPVYRRFLFHSKAAALIRENNVYLMAEATYVAAALIQAVWRRHRVVNRRRNMKTRR